MWKKSRFLNAVGDNVGANSWANDTQNGIGGLYLYEPFENENFANAIYENGDWTTLAPVYSGNGGCISGSDLASSGVENAVYNAVNSPTSDIIYDQNLVKINQWVELDITACFDVYNVGEPQERLFYQGPPVYAKILYASSFYGFKPLFAVGIYYDGELYDNLDEAEEVYISNYGGDISSITYGSLGVIPLIANGVPVKTLQELENFINPEGETPMLTPGALSSTTFNTMPDLQTLQSTLATQLADRDSQLQGLNTTVTSLLGDYYEAVEFATTELESKEVDLNTALALCQDSNGNSEACLDVNALSTEVGQLRDNLDILEDEKTVKDAIEVALDTIAGGGTVAGGETLGDANADILGIQTELQTRSATIVDRENEISVLEEQVDDLQTAVASGTSDIEGLTDELATQYSTLNNYNRRKT